MSETLKMIVRELPRTMGELNHKLLFKDLKVALKEVEVAKFKSNILHEALEKIVKLKDNQSLSYEKWELMVDVAVDALNRSGGGE